MWYATVGVDSSVSVYLAGGNVSELPRRTKTFIVRLWAEYLEHSPADWRGEIECVGDGEVMHFCDLHEIGDLIQKRVLAQHSQDTAKKSEEN
jgi:hypothetical protein